jgi:hypothetical protein
MSDRVVAAGRGDPADHEPAAGGLLARAGGIAAPAAVRLTRRRVLLGSGCAALALASPAAAVVTSSRADTPFDDGTWFDDATGWL